MSYLKYTIRSLTRNPLRCILTVLSVAFSLAMLTVLYGYIATQQVWPDQAAKYNRLVVMNTQGFSGDVPIAYVDRVRGIDSVSAAVPYQWFGGTYKEQRVTFAQFGTDPQYVFQVWDEFKIDPAQLKSWQETRNGCVADQRTAKRYGWKIGDRIPLVGTYLQCTLDLTLCGTFEPPKSTDSIWFHWEYLDELLKKNNVPGAGNAGTIFLKVASQDAAASLSKVIDDKFASSQYPTRTQSEAAFAQMFAEMLGDVQFLIRIISIAVVIALCFVAATTMAMSLRERTTEVAVLKAIGFNRARVSSMVLAESFTMSLASGILGVVVGCGALQLLHQLSPQTFPLGIREIAGPWLGMGLLMALAIGLLSGIFPAIHSAQLRVVDGLRRIA